MRRIARLPGLARLRRLQMVGCGFGEAGAAAMIGSRHLARIEELGLGCLNYYERETRIGDSALAALSLPRRLPALQKLRLVEAQAQPVAWQTFARSALAGQLSQLEIDQTPLGEKEVEALFHGARLKPDSLSLGVMRCDLTTLELLLRSPVLRGVRKLDLSDMSDDFAEQGARLLARQPPLDLLRELNLSFNSLGGNGAEALADSPVLSSLRVLHLSGNDLGPAGVGWLARSEALAGLTTLSLFNNRLGNEGIEALEGATFAGSLRSLVLGANRLTAEGIARLARSSKFPSLRRLALSESPIDVKGVRAIMNSPLFASLQNLTLDPGNVPERQLGRLQQHFGARLYLLTEADYV
jgi:hypothetical protein